MFYLKGVTKWNICERKSEFYTQIIILLNALLKHVHLTANAVALK